MLPGELFSKLREKDIDAAIAPDGGLVFWGDPKPVSACLGVDPAAAIPHEFDDPTVAVADSTHLKSFYEAGLIRALCQDSPVVLRKKGRAFYAVVDGSREGDKLLYGLKKAVGGKDGPGRICGIVPNLEDVTWAEAVQLRLEERGGMVWLMLEPDIWIKPLRRREEAIDFLRVRKLRRWNRQSYEILSAWIEILLGSVGGAGMLDVTYGAQTPFPATFTLSTRTSFSRREVASG
jgi:hypothetical protein